jgi:hypothetical protein
MAELPRFF